MVPLLLESYSQLKGLPAECTVPAGIVAQVLVVLLTFQGEMQQQVLLIPVLYSLFIVPTSSAVTAWFRRITTREGMARDNAKVPTAAVPAAA